MTRLFAASFFFLNFFALVLGPRFLHATGPGIIPGAVPIKEGDKFEDYCDIEARFVGEGHTNEKSMYRGMVTKETRVRWEFEIISANAVNDGICPGHTSFDMAIREAKFEGGSYVYPDKMTPPRPHQVVLLKVHKVQVRDMRTGDRYDEWLVTDWTEGFRIKANAVSGT